MRIFDFLCIGKRWKQVACFGNFLYFCIEIWIDMANNAFLVIFLQAVDDFLSTLPLKAREKIIYNVRKVKSGIMDA